jgi:GntR family transcriptional regulator
MTIISSIPSQIRTHAAIPLYHQVYLILKEKIISHEYIKANPLPTEEELCEEFNVSRITIKRAMRELAIEELVIRHRGKGTFVAGLDNRRLAPNAMDDLLESVQAIGDATEVEQISEATFIPKDDVKEKLKLTHNEKVLCSTHLRLVNKAPLAIITTYIPEYIADQLNSTNKKVPMLVQLRNAGIPVDSALQQVTATLAEPRIALQLNVGIGAPLLKLTRLVLDTANKPIEWLISYYRGDKYAMRTKLNHHITGRISTWKPSKE